ncbi:hypothetical protein MNBD_GAMMA10-3190 [hydrothermal vent metagenome]|uniref:Uncharacterized protein n=1 Tax=hydrothermal vent metagenome TaxID=652676 RepID=A0A3B0Y0B7_9ZZZZ
MTLKALRRHNYKHFITVAISLFVYQSPVIASDDAYLKELEAEVDSTSIPQTSPDAASQQTKTFAERSKNIEKFEKKLNRDLPATYHAYKRLNRDNQLKVVDYYFSHNLDMNATTHLLFNLYFSSKNKH